MWNRLGMTVAYKTVCESMNTMAEHNWEKTGEGSRRGKHLGMLLTIV